MPLFEVDAAGSLTGCCNFVCEIPKWTRKKFEISTDEDHNPIKQDTKKGVLRAFKSRHLGEQTRSVLESWRCGPLLDVLLNSLGAHKTQRSLPRASGI